MLILNVLEEGLKSRALSDGEGCISCRMRFRSCLPDSPFVFSAIITGAPTSNRHSTTLQMTSIARVFGSKARMSALVEQDYQRTRKNLVISHQIGKWLDALPISIRAAIGGSQATGNSDVLRYIGSCTWSCSEYQELANSRDIRNAFITDSS